MDTIYQKIVLILPKRLIYFVLIYVWAKITTEKYSDKVISKVTMDECVGYWYNS